MDIKLISFFVNHNNRNDNMKKILLLAITMFATLGITAKTSTTPAQKLIKRMARLQKMGVMIGHQDDPVYGRTWKWERNRSDVKDLTGDYPAVMGFDLGWIELDSAVELDHVPFERVREEAVRQHQRGGIVTFSWHPTNPVTGGSAWDPSGEVIGKILPGGSHHAKFHSWLVKVARFLASLKTPDGAAIPVIFRPWHEMGGTWFWWGPKGGTAEQYKELYRMTHDVLTKECGLRNLVFGYSPNGGPEETVDNFMKFYPGDEYVDLLGFDLYDFDKDNAKYMKLMKAELDVLQQLGKQHKKLIAITETGAQTLPDNEWFTQVFWKVAQNYPISYVLFWRNAWDNEKELYMSYKGHPTQNDFLKFHALKKTLFVNDIKKK